MRATAFVQSYFDAWNHLDPIAVADHLDRDGTYCDIPENTHRSHDELIVSLEEFFATYRHRYELIGDILEGPNTIAFQYRMYPPVQGRNAGTHGSAYGAEFVTLNGGAAMSIYDYYNDPGIASPARAAGLTTPAVRLPKYAKSGLSDERMAAHKNRLLDIMLAQQTYLQPDVTLPKLAQAVNCSVNHLSQVINAGFGMSFFDFLNSYRVEHAKNLLARLDRRSNAVLNVAFAVGFSSNSAFYSAFKRHVGQTPAQYRRLGSNNTH